MSLIRALTLSLILLSVILIFAGGLVTTTDSGLTIPDWPTSRGQWFPELEGGAVYEHTHRLIAGAVALLTLLLYALVMLRSQNKPMRFWTSAALSLVILQALLGGATVLMGLYKPISVLHALIGPTFMGLIAYIDYLSVRSSQPGDAAPAAQQQGRVLVGSLLAIAYLQLFSGAVVRHISAGWIHLHLLGALALLVHAILLLKKGVFTRHKRWIFSLTLVQWILGLGALLFVFFHPERAHLADSVLTITLHQTVGALLLALVLLYAFRLRHETHTTGR